MNVPEYNAALSQAIAEFEESVLDARSKLSKRVEGIRALFFEDQDVPMAREHSEKAMVR